MPALIQATPQPALHGNDQDSQEPTGNPAMDPLTILLIGITTLVVANLAAARQKA